MDILAKVIENDHTANGNIPEGFLFASVKNVGNKNAVVNGVELVPGEAKSYAFVGKGYQAVSFETNGSTLRVLYVL